MTRALDGRGLEVYCQKLTVSQEIQEMIALLRSSPLSRNPREHKGNVRIWYPSKKMAGIVKAESRRVEFPGLLEAEYDDVLNCFNQPPLSRG